MIRPLWLLMLWIKPNTVNNTIHIGKYDVYQVWKSGCEYLYNHKLNMLWHFSTKHQKRCKYEYKKQTGWIALSYSLKAFPMCCFFHIQKSPYSFKTSFWHTSVNTLILIINLSVEIKLVLFCKRLEGTRGRRCELWF